MFHLSKYTMHCYCDIGKCSAAKQHGKWKGSYKGYNTRMEITLTELEDAINYWRTLRPSLGEERALSPEVNSLATVYAMMIFNRSRTMPLEAFDQAGRQLLETWRTQRA